LLYTVYLLALEGYQMNIVQPYAVLQHFDDAGHPCEFTPAAGVRLLRIIEHHARISHRSEDKQTDESWERFLQFVVQTKGDWSVVEHASAHVKVFFDRGIQQEWTRHRLSSYTIESTRFVNYEKKMPASFIMPDGLSDDCERAPNGEQTTLSQQQLWRHAISTSEKTYRDLVRSGVAPQLARSVLPLALGSLGGITANLRVWRHELIMRTTKEAHPQIKQLMVPLLAEFQQKIPILFDDIVPDQFQAEAIKKAR
jgi:thymidylate synthase (FAD)